MQTKNRVSESNLLNRKKFKRLARGSFLARKGGTDPAIDANALAQDDQFIRAVAKRVKQLATKPRKGNDTQRRRHTKQTSE